MTDLFPCDAQNINLLYLDIDSGLLPELPEREDLSIREPECKKTKPASSKPDFRVRSLVRLARRMLLEEFKSHVPANYNKMSNTLYTTYMKEFLSQELDLTQSDQDERIVKSVLMMCLNQQRFNRNYSLQNAATEIGQFGNPLKFSDDFKALWHSFTLQKC